jgi:multicomponent Na+:H+ antiporter subunit F
MIIIIINILFGLLVVSMGLALIRLIRGPSLPDRVVALDLIAITAVGVIGVYAVAVDQPIYIDDALVLALIAFFGTVAFAHFIEKGGISWRRS